MLLVNVEREDGVNKLVDQKLMKSFLLLLPYREHHPLFFAPFYFVFFLGQPFLTLYELWATNCSSARTTATHSCSIKGWILDPQRSFHSQFPSSPQSADKSLDALSLSITQRIFHIFSYSAFVELWILSWIFDAAENGKVNVIEYENVLERYMEEKCEWIKNDFESTLNINGKKCEKWSSLFLLKY